MTKVKIQLGSTYHDADGNAHGPGSEIELDDTIAQALIAGGSALACGGTVTVEEIASVPLVGEPYAVGDIPARRSRIR